MFIPVTESEKQDFLTQTTGSFIPGYTGHCPTLKFHYGKCYGAKTKEIMQELRDKGFLRDVKREQYRADDPGKVILQPIVRSKGQSRDYSLDTRCRSQKYIIGYTGFIPTLNFRYGKSFGRTADDSMYEFAQKQRQIREEESAVRMDRMYRAKSAPRMIPIRSQDEIARALKDYENKHKFTALNISPEFPPIAGYTGHIPRVKVSEESLSHRYDTVVRRGLTLLKEDREKRRALKQAQKKISTILAEHENKYVGDHIEYNINVNN